MAHWAHRGAGRAYLVSPDLGFPVRTLHAFMAEMAPRSSSKTHRHVNEAVIHVLQGAGHTVLDLDGPKVEWKAHRCPGPVADREPRGPRST